MFSNVFINKKHACPFLLYIFQLCYHFFFTLCVQLWDGNLVEVDVGGYHISSVQYVKEVFQSVFSDRVNKHHVPGNVICYGICYRLISFAALIKQSSAIKRCSNYRLFATMNLSPTFTRLFSRLFCRAILVQMPVVIFQVPI